MKEKYIEIIMPTVFYHEKYRFYFYSNEYNSLNLLEPIHVHIESAEKEAKFWIEGGISLALNKGFRSQELKEIEKIIEMREEEIIQRWKIHFKLL